MSRARRLGSSFDLRILWLLIPGLALLWAAWSADRAGWRQLRPGETTVLMQAESLLRDGDLTFERLDYERHVVTRYGEPRELALASGTGGRVVTYDASFVPALLFAGGLALFGELGFMPVNALLLLLAALLARRLLGHQSAAPWLAILIFASIAFTTVFRASADALLFAATLLAAALVRGGSGESRLKPRRLALAGLLLSLALFTRWQHALLLLPFLVALLAPDAGVSEAKAEPDRGRRGMAFAIGLLAGLAAQSFVLFWAGGGLGAVDTVRFVFTPASGFPFIDLPADGWAQTVERLDALYFIGAPRIAWALEPHLMLENLLHYVGGRHIGLLTYAAVPLLLLLAGARRRVTLALVAALSGLIALALLLEPFDLAGGGAPGNPHWLPWLAASALAWRPRLDGRRVDLVAAGLALLALPLLGVHWLAADAPWAVEGPRGLEPHPTAALARLLPYELNQQTHPGRDLDHGGLRVRLLSRSLDEAKAELLTLDGAADAHLWVASPEPLVALTLHFGEAAPAQLELLGPSVEAGARLSDRVLRADGGVSFRLEIPARRHGLWWSPRRQWLYRVDYRLPEAGDQTLAFSLGGEVRGGLTGEIRGDR